MLAVRAVTKRWPGEDRPVLADIDLDVAPGEAVWIGGTNGAGKTTLLRSIAGLLLPDAGTVRLCGLDPEHDRRAFQRRLGFVPAGNGGLYARMTVLEHLRMWAGVAMVPRALRAEAVDAVVEQLALGALAGRRVDRMSLGQRQRVRLAMGFLHRPALILLDEPRTSLDGEGAEALVRAVRQHVTRGGAVLWCSPVGEPVGFPVDRRLLMTAGRLEAEA